MKEKEIQHIREDIPITGYDPETNSFYCGDGSHILRCIRSGRKIWSIAIRMRLKWTVSGGRNFIKPMGKILKL